MIKSNCLPYLTRMHWAKTKSCINKKCSKDPRIVNATVSSYKPQGQARWQCISYPEGHDNEIMRTQEYHVDEQYIPTLGMTMASGRNFSKDFLTDSTAMIINETAAKAYGWNDMSCYWKNNHQGKQQPRSRYSLSCYWRCKRF